MCADIRRRTPRSSGRIAVMAPGREPVDYDSLWTRTAALARRLDRHGLARGDAVAMAMPEGPEALETLLAITQVAACAPLNPAFRADEFAFSLSDLEARALIVPSGADSAAAGVALSLGIPVLEVPVRGHDSAGDRTPAAGLAAHRRDAARYPPETALLLHTSATTGRPKLVPLTHAQIIAMIDVARTTFPQADEGRVLIMTPHFHLHCLVSILVQLFSGGAVVCTPGFRPESFLGWMREFRPTQYTANPTLHRAILSLLPLGGPGDVFRSLRFVSSAGAPLPETLRDEIERRLGVPVFEGYGLTEAGRVTLTPAEPARRKPGSAGKCYGVDVAITDEEGRQLRPGLEGEIVLRGPTVLTGYAHDPEANRQAFRNGWFRTGDLGWLDDEGFLYITGRIKEAINRGSEKILPYEIEQVLSQHPAVREAVAFGFPHGRLGEDIGAAVVLRPDAVATAPDLRRFAAEHLAEFKIPRQIVFLSEIPKGRTGKPQRARMAEFLNATQARPSDGSPELDPLEAQLAAIWHGLLAVSPIGRDDDFFLLGGDSLLALEMLVQAEAACACDLGPDAVMASATLGSLAAAVRKAQAEARALPDGGRAASCLRTLQPNGPGRPLFLMCPEGDVFVYRHLVRRLGQERPVFGLEWARFLARKSSPVTLEALAHQYVTELREVQAKGPYWVGGYSLGGLLALETARHLLSAGETIAGLIIIDSDCFRWLLQDRLRVRWRTIRLLLREHRIGYLRELGARSLQRLLSGPPATVSPQPATMTYRAAPIPVRALLLRCLDSAPIRRDLLRRHWSRIIKEELLIRDVPGTHFTAMVEPHVGVVAEEVRRFMARLEGAPHAAARR